MVDIISSVVSSLKSYITATGCLKAIIITTITAVNTTPRLSIFFVYA